MEVNFGDTVYTLNVYPTKLIFRQYYKCTTEISTL